MDINQFATEDTYLALGIDKISPAEQQAVLADLGKVVFETAVGRFVLTLDDWALESFENWIKEHSADTNLTEDLVTLYPVLGNILSEEILIIKQSLQKAAL